MRQRRTAKGKGVLPWTCLLLSSLLLPLHLAGPAAAADGRQEVTVGIVDTFPPDFYVDTYSATIDHLAAALPQYDFRFVEVNDQALEADVRRLHPNFLVTSASTFVAMIEPFGAHQVATKHPDAAQDASHTVGSAFIVRQESPVRTIRDLAGRRVAASSARSFDGWLIAAGEIARSGGDPEKFFGERTFTDYAIPDPALLVRMKAADAAVLPACGLEELEASGQVPPGTLRVLEDRSGGRGCRRSTPLYPDAVFSSLAGVPPDIVRDVTVALLTMPHEGRDFQWTIADDFVPTYALLNALRLPPYSPRPLTAGEFWAAWRTEILLALVLLGAVVFHIVSVNLLVQRRTRELRASLAETRHYFEEVQASRSRLVLLERLQVVGQLSALFAHEIKQPLLNISLYAASLGLLLRKRGVEDERTKELLSRMAREVDRSSEIVEHVRGYARMRETKREPVALGGAVREAVRLAAVRPPVQVDAAPGAAGLTVLADPFEMLFILTNFLKNAAAAVAAVSSPRITVRVAQERGRAVVSVEDNGPALTDEAFAALGRAGRSGKADGLGFGLAIAQGLAEKSGGHVAFERLSPDGLRVSLILDSMNTDSGRDGRPEKEKPHEA